MNYAKMGKACHLGLEGVPIISKCYTQLKVQLEKIVDT